MNPDFNALFEQYVYAVASEVIGEATPAEQTALIGLLLRADVERPVRTGSTVAPKQTRRRSTYVVLHQVRRELLELSLSKNEQQINQTLASISQLEDLITYTKHTLQNEELRCSIVGGHQRALAIYDRHLARLQAFNHRLSLSLCQLA
ncbi:hypothetical protein [Spirosoma pomorum]